MYKNSVNLIGFLGNDATNHTGNNNRSFTTLSLATKSSYKDKKSDMYRRKGLYPRGFCSSSLLCGPDSHFFPVRFLFPRYHLRYSRTSFPRAVARGISSIA